MFKTVYLYKKIKIRLSQSKDTILYDKQLVFQLDIIIINQLQKYICDTSI